jgi:hypothetical protein
MAALKFLRRHASGRVCTLPALTFYKGGTFIVQALIALAAFALVLLVFSSVFIPHTWRPLLGLLLVRFATLAGFPGLGGSSDGTCYHYFAFTFSDSWTADSLWRFGLNNPMAYDRSSGNALNAVDFDAPVDDALIDHHIVGDILCHVDQVDVTLTRRIVGTQAWCQNAAFFHKRKPAWIDVYISLRRSKANADAETYLRRQRRPANPPG